MQTAIKVQPGHYPNPYFYDPDNHKYGTITFIFWRLTPTGRRSKYFKQIRLSQKGERINYTFDQFAADAKQIAGTDTEKLQKGNTWSQMYIHHNFLR